LVRKTTTICIVNPSEVQNLTGWEFQEISNTKNNNKTTLDLSSAFSKDIASSKVSYLQQRNLKAKFKVSQKNS